MSHQVAPFLGIMFAPRRTYRALADSSPLRPGGLPLIAGGYLGWIGACLAMLNTGGLDVLTGLDAALCWSFLVPLQLGFLALLSGHGPSATIPFGERARRYYLGFGPWLLWLWALASVRLFVPPPHDVHLGFLLPMSLALVLAWGFLIKLQFFRAGLGLGPWRALLAAALHGAGVWGAPLAFFWISGQLTPRVLEIMGGSP